MSVPTIQFDAQHARSDAAPVPRSLKLLRSFTRLIPPVPHASGVGNRVVKPLWCASHADADSYVLPVWDGVLMIVNPRDMIGGNLTFVPQLYERWGRAAVRRLLRRGDTFVDLGANIGAYSLWVAKLVGPTGTVVAVEPEPRNCTVLRRNVELNGLLNVKTFSVGVSDRSEALTLLLNESNSGGHSFVGQPYARGAGVEVPCKPLADVLRDAKVARVDVMKVDIEGFEEKVLTKFFEDVPRESPLRPNHILTELWFGRRSPEDDRIVRSICAGGYELVSRQKGNALFRRAALEPATRGAT
jgi:FkbM family methyltransferase